MNKYYSFVMIVVIVSLSACDAGRDSPKGFSLPKGDKVKGKQVFIKHQCLSCHLIADVEANGITRELEEPIQLGRKTAKVITYAELLTSIINPSHKISRGYLVNSVDESGNSIMRNYNDVMTVAELVDLVTYLQPHFKVTPVEYSPYRNYYVH
ncbi:MAG: sulfur-oxidizing protein SoxX [Glaciecola sp.]|jgi:sulfur-oxidizing protein SoxX